MRGTRSCRPRGRASTTPIPRECAASRPVRRSSRPPPARTSPAAARRTRAPRPARQSSRRERCPAGKYNVRAPRATASATQSSKLKRVGRDLTPPMQLDDRRCCRPFLALSSARRTGARVQPLAKRINRGLDFGGSCRGAECGDQVSRGVLGGCDVFGLSQPAQPDDQLVVQSIGPHLDGISGSSQDKPETSSGRQQAFRPSSDRMSRASASIDTRVSGTVLR